MPIIIRIGLIILAIITFATSETGTRLPLSVPCQAASSWEEPAPHGAVWGREYVFHPVVPEGFSALVGWINVATDVPCALLERERPQVALRNMRIVEQREDGSMHSVSHIDAQNEERFTGRLFPRVPEWFGETEGSNEHRIVFSENDTLRINIGKTPLRVYHAWSDPRIPAEPNKNYFIEADIRVTEGAAIQFGLDYWRDLESDYNGWDENCLNSNNCEGWVSRWYLDTEGEWKTVRSPDF